jgi:hypothetical protein
MPSPSLSPLSLLPFQMLLLLLLLLSRRLADTSGRSGGGFLRAYA